MSKTINRAINLAGEDQVIGSLTQRVLEYNSDGTLARRIVGKTKPVDGTAGYTRGAKFTRSTDDAIGNTGPRDFENIGSTTKCKFVPMTVSDKQMFEEFRAIPTIVKNDGYSTPTGSTGDVNVMITERNKFEYHIKGTQTILAPVFSASGLNIAMDQTNNDGVELTNGITSRGKQTFTVGTDPGFYFTATLTIADVSGTDDLAVGFRKAEAYQANVDDCDEAAFLNVISGAIKIETILNNAATTTTDTTQTVADAGTVTLTVKVSSSGQVTYEINGAAPTVTANYTFDNGEVVVPFLYFLNDSDLCDTLYLTKWEVGYL